VPEPLLLPYGERALLVQVAPADVGRLQVALAGLVGVEIVPAASSLLVRPSAVEQLDELRAAVATIIARPLPPAPTASSGTLVPVRVVYDGPDLAEVAELTGLGVAGVVAAHTGTPWRVAFGGFAPGFAYLADGDPRLVVPRRSEPRTSVPAGSVGLAGEFSGVYPRESPGGWQLVGRTDAVLWDARRTPPALLSPGTWVRFEAVSS
jgi:KipI family sensor histidine kinase inhibitor